MNQLYLRPHWISFPKVFCQMAITLPPSRTHHKGENGADVQQGPVLRFLFRLRPCINLFISFCFILCWRVQCPKKLSALSVCTRLTVLERDIVEAAWFILCLEFYSLTTYVLSPCQISTHALTPRSITKGCIRPGKLWKVRTPIGSVRRREFGLICISSESCLWSIVGLPGSCVCYLTFRYIS